MTPLQSLVMERIQRRVDSQRSDVVDVTDTLRGLRGALLLEGIRPEYIVLAALPPLLRQMQNPQGISVTTAGATVQRVEGVGLSFPPRGTIGGCTKIVIHVRETDAVLFELTRTGWVQSPLADRPRTTTCTVDLGHMFPPGGYDCGTLSTEHAAAILGDMRDGKWDLLGEEFARSLTVFYMQRTCVEEPPFSWTGLFPTLHQSIYHEYMYYRSLHAFDMRDLPRHALISAGNCRMIEQWSHLMVAFPPPDDFAHDQRLESCVDPLCQCRSSKQVERLRSKLDLERTLARYRVSEANAAEARQSAQLQLVRSDLASTKASLLEAKAKLDEAALAEANAADVTRCVICHGVGVDTAAVHRLSYGWSRRVGHLFLHKACADELEAACGEEGPKCPTCRVPAEFVTIR